jgi:hypothetical protein
MENTHVNLEHKESSAVWDSDKGSCSETLHGAAKQNPVEQRAGETPLTGEEYLSPSSPTSENLENLTEKVGTIGLQVTRKKSCGAAKKRPRKAKLAEVPTKDSDGSQPRSAVGDQPQTLQKPGKSGAHKQGPSKQQRSAGGTREDWRAKRPRQSGKLSYAGAAREGFRVAVVCEDHPRRQISRQNFADIQRAFGRLVDELPEEGFTPRLVDSYRAKMTAILVCQGELTKDWLTARVPTLVAWKGSRLKIVGPDALPTYTSVAWFPGPVEDTE